MSEPPTVFRVGPKDRGKRLDRFLRDRIPGLSRTRIQRAIRHRVRLSWGAPARPAARVFPGGEVRVGYPASTEVLVDLAIPLLREEPGWLAVDKPPGIPVHPVNGVCENSLIRILRRQQGETRLRLVHRLDRETSGVLLIARDAGVARILSGAFEKRRVHKEYLAVVRGVVKADEGVVRQPIGPALHSHVFVRLETGGHGRPAETAWRVERRLQDRTLLRVYPRTGRRHQIRVHLAATGHPVMGDPLYGRPDGDYLDLVRGFRDPRVAEGGPRRQLLHCERLVIPAPGRDGEITIVSPMPDDFMAALSGDR